MKREIWICLIIGCQRNAEREFKLFYLHVSLDCGEQVMSLCEQGVELQGFHDEEKATWCLSSTQT